MGPDDDEPDLTPPDAERVARRALSLAALAVRAFFDGRDPQILHGLLAWVAQIGLRDELEPAEVALLDTPPGRLGPKQVADASWRTEGVAVLAWALGRSELPPHDTQADAQALFDGLGVFRPDPGVLRAPSLRPPEEIAWQADRLLGIHWRLRDFSLRPTPADLVGLAAGAIWFGGFDLDGVPVAEGDLALGGVPIARADPASVRSASSIAVERHQAVNWLLGMDPIYSEVDTST